jgi:hypothetical protein
VAGLIIVAVMVMVMVACRPDRFPPLLPCMNALGACVWYGFRWQGRSQGQYFRVSVCVTLSMRSMLRNTDVEAASASAA